MKRKIFATVMALVLCTTTLVGCGHKNDSSPAPADYVESDGPAITDGSDTGKNVTATPYTNEQGEILMQAPNDDIIGNEDFEQAPKEENASLDAESMEEEVLSETGEIEGIIVLTMYPSHSQLCVVVDTVNPNNGSVQNILSTQITPVIATNEYGYVIFPENPRFGNLQDLFTPDFSKIAVTRVATSNQSMHAGWMDKDGNFFDVTAAVGEAEASDFEDPARYQAIGFTDDGATFVYKQVDNYSNYAFETLGYYAVSVDNMAAGASWEISPSDAYLHADTSSWWWLNDYRFSDKIDGTHFYADNGNSNTNSCVLIDTESQTMSEFIPGETRNNWSVVASPDGQQVAFISRPKSGQLNSVELYTMRLDDCTTNHVLDINSPEEAHLPTIRGEYDGVDIFCAVLDWR